MPIFNDNDLQAVRDAVSIVDVVGELVSLKKKGNKYWACCPFHNEKTPSFVVDESKGIYHCFGCGESGDSIQFVMEHENVSFVEAIQVLANKYNITLSEGDSEEEKQSYQDKQRLYSTATWVASHYYNSFKLHPKRNEVIDYFKHRGLKGETVKYFQIGFAYPEHVLHQYAQKQLRKVEDLATLGLYHIENNKHVFANRIVFPIQNHVGNTVGFGGRAMSGKQQPKYLNSPESTIFSKRNTLYALYENKKEIRKEGNAYLVEGYFDVAMLWQYGTKNAVATCGTAFTTEQAKLLKKSTPKVTIAFDTDKAGIKATHKAIEIALQVGLQVDVVQFEQGQDPADFANTYLDSTPEALQSCTISFVDFILDNHDNKVEATKELCKLLSLIDRIQAEEYLQKVATKTGIRLETLLTYLVPNNTTVIVANQPTTTPEEEIITLLACFGDVKRDGITLAEYVINELDNIPFEEEFSRQVRIAYENQLILNKSLHYTSIVLQLDACYTEKYLYLVKKYYTVNIDSKTKEMVAYAYQKMIEFKILYCNKRIQEEKDQLNTTQDKEYHLNLIKGFQTLKNLLIKNLNEIVCKSKKTNSQQTSHQQTLAKPIKT